MASEQISFKSFVDEMKSVTYGTHPRRFCFVLGAGASRNSGIKSGQELVKIWDKELRERNEEDYSRWRDELKITDSNMSNYYSNYYEKRFNRCPADGLNYIESIMESAKPSAGYVMLAYLLTNTPHKIVVTTNFDHLTEDAINYYAHETPLVVGHESLSHYVTAHPTRPTIVKIHHDLLFDPKSRSEDLQTLPENWISALERIFENFHPVFIGYAGNDKNLMDFLISHNSNFSNNHWKYPYWLLYKTDPFDGSVKTFMDGSNGIIVRHDGFDEVMIQLGASFGYKIPAEDEFLVDAKQRFAALKDAIDEFSDKTNRVEAVESRTASSEKAVTQAEDAGDSDTSSDDVNQAMDQITKESEAQNMYLEATKLIRDEKYHEARDILKQLIEQEPDNVRYRCKYVETFYYLGEYADGLVETKKAIELSSSYYYSHFLLGLFLQKLKQESEALSAFKKAAELKPDWALVHYCIANILEEKDEKIEALFEYRKATECDPDWDKPYYCIGTILKEMGQLPDALSAFKACANLAPEWNAIHYAIGSIHEKMQLYEDALTAYQTASKLDPDWALCHYKVAEMLNNLKRYDEALHEIEIAISFLPSEFYFYDCLATALRGLNRLKEAKAAEKKATELYQQEEDDEDNE